jgi:hypothetical protein
MIDNLLSRSVISSEKKERELDGKRGYRLTTDKGILFL